MVEQLFTAAVGQRAMRKKRRNNCSLELGKKVGARDYGLRIGDCGEGSTHPRALVPDQIGAMATDQVYCHAYGLTEDSWLVVSKTAIPSLEWYSLIPIPVFHMKDFHAGIVRIKTKVHGIFVKPHTGCAS